MGNPSFTPKEGGAINFAEMSGMPNLVQVRVKDIAVLPAADCHEYLLLGKRGEEYTLATLVDISSAANAKTEIGKYMKAVGTMVTVTDAQGVTYDVQMVLGVRPVSLKAVVKLSGGVNVGRGGDGFLLRAEWRLQDGAKAETSGSSLPILG